MGQRLVRAKTKIRASRHRAFACPSVDELRRARSTPVLDAIYAAYAEGWSRCRGHRRAASQPRRRGDLARPARRVAAAHASRRRSGLLALMLHAHARRAARRNRTGDYVPIAEQDTALWDGAVDRGSRGAFAARRGARPDRPLPARGRGAVRARVRRTAHRLPWAAIVRLYDALLELTGSPVTAINRAVALVELEGPQAALVALDALEHDARLRDYQPYWAARAELLARSGSRERACEAYERAIGLERDPAVRRFLQRRAAATTG